MICVHHLDLEMMKPQLGWESSRERLVWKTPCESLARVWHCLRRSFKSRNHGLQIRGCIKFHRFSRMSCDPRVLLPFYDWLVSNQDLQKKISRVMCWDTSRPWTKHIQTITMGRYSDDWCTGAYGIDCGKGIHRTLRRDRERSSHEGSPHIDLWVRLQNTKWFSCQSNINVVDANQDCARCVTVAMSCSLPPNTVYNELSVST